MKAVCDTTDACILAWLDPWSRIESVARRVSSLVLIGCRSLPSVPLLCEILGIITSVDIM